MNKFYNLIALFIIVLFFNVFPKPSPLLTSNINTLEKILFPLPGVITVTSPNGDESWQSASSKVISWNDNLSENVKIELYKGGVFHSVISISTSSDGFKTWDIPDTTPSGTDYTIKITSVDSSNVFDFSDINFTIYPPVITVTAPNGSENWFIGSSYLITWTDNIFENVELQLYKAGSFFTSITTSTASDGSYTWNIPGGSIAGSDYKIRIASVSNSNIFDESDANFNLLSQIIVGSPNNSENWRTGSTQNITWTDNINENVMIELYKGGTLNSTIISSTPSTGSYIWTIPAGTATGSNYKIKITSVSDPGTFDFSDSDFTIFEGSITVTSPNGAESWNAGTTETITWTDNITENVMIDLYKGGSFHSIISTTTSSDGSKTWNIPFVLESGSDYRVKITSVNDPGISDLSNTDFTIVGNQVTVTSPNGGESWQAGSSQIINWTDNLTGSVEIQLYKGGAFHSSINTSTPSDGTYTWNISNTLVPGSDYKIRISSVDDGNVFDLSDGNFTIINNNLTVNSPNGGESWSTGSTQDITWTDDISGNVKIELYKAEVFNSSIVSSTQSDGSYLWNIPGGTATGSDYKVKITSIDQPTLSDLSNSSFTIFTAQITVSSPDGGESWQAGTSQNIIWTDNITENVSIDLYKGGSFHSTISTSTSSDGLKSWNIPFALESGSDYKVKITSINDPGVSDLSNADFTIVGNQITVTTPNGGEDYLTGSSQIITWTDNLTGSVEIQLFKGGVFNSSITISTASDGAYTWNIPGSIVTGSDYKIKILSVDDGNIFDLSDANFALSIQITVTSPNGGESWLAGHLEFITWNDNIPDIELVKIELHKGGSLETVLFEAEDADGSKRWTIPPDITLGTDYKIKVISVDDNTVFDISDGNFSIQTGNITVTLPNGGESWQAGSSQSINWTDDITENVMIELYKGGSFHSTIIATTASDGSKIWDIPFGIESGSDYTVKITKVGDPNVLDFSDNNFTIVGNQLTATTPNGGENWQAGSSQIITWTDNLTGSVEIQLYKAGAFLSSIIASTPSDGAYTWNIPGTTVAGSDYQIKMLSVDNGNVFDLSDGNFTIINNNLTVNSPNGGENWSTGSTQDITWTDDISGNVKIELYKAEVFKSTIASSTTSDGSYLWNIPGATATGSDYKIKITSIDQPTLSDLSNSSFTIFTAQITVSSPDGGESWQAGSLQNITWTDNIIENIMIELYKGGSFHSIISTSTSSDGTKTWNIPFALESGSDYKVKITSVNDPGISNLSNTDFTIVGNQVTVTTPNGGEDYLIGSSQIIAWTDNLTGNVEIQLYKGGAFLSSIVTSTTSDGAYTWNISNSLIQGSDYKIRISSVDDDNIFDLSDANFTLSGEIIVTVPNSGEKWQEGTSHTISWTDNISGNVKIELYKGGSFDSDITPSTPSDGSFTWDIPVGTAVGLNYKVKITSVGNASISDFSDANFEIFAGVISVNTPNGGESWLAGTTQTITWTDNIIENVMIDLYKGGVFHSVISTSTSSDGSKTWNIPFALESGSDYKVKITSVNDPVISDFSDANFTIVGNQITITSPNGGESWQAGTSQIISWTDNLTGSVEIQLFKSGVFNFSITTSTASDGAYTWNISNSLVQGIDYTIKILSVNDGNVFDLSDGNLTIINNNLTINSPNGGENWSTGSTQDITWTDDISGNVKIELYQAEVFNSTIVSSTPSDGSYLWNVPGGTATGSDYKVKITSIDQPTLSDLSNSSFTIFTAQITVSSPDGGESWQAGTIQTITWTDNIIENVMIDLYKGGSFHSVISTSTSSDGSKTWNIPFALESGSDYKVKITSINDPGISDLSNADFTIVGNQVTVTTPNGGEDYLIGSSQIITWTDNLTGSVQIQLYKGGTFYSSLTVSTPNDGAYTWIISNSLIQSSDYMIRISSVDDDNIFDLSDANFSLSNEIIVTSPNGGENWLAGKLEFITWNDNIPDNNLVKIELYKGGSLNTVLFEAEDADGSKRWTIDPAITPGTDYRIKVISVDDNNVFDISDADFTISRSNITVTSPNGGESWQAGSSQSINWTDDFSENVLIELYKGGSFHSTIVATTASDGSKIWNIPFTLESGTDYSVKIAKVGDPNVFDFSDNNFTIVGNQVTVTTPNGGEDWQAGSSQIITWTDNLTGNVEIQLFKGGVFNSSIITSTASDGVFTWNIPGTTPAGSDYKVNIISVDDGNVFDLSDANFTLSNELIVTIPNGGESWQAGTSHTINWTDNITGNVKIELYDNGSFDSEITPSSPSNGSFAWDIPVGIATGTKIKIKISSVDDASVFDFSDADFEIFAGNITVITPNGGESWQAGTAKSITWTDNIAENITIDLYKGGTFHSIISTSTSSDGTRNWNIPFALESGNNYTVKITSVSDPGISDFSNSSFTIIGNQVTIITPNGGEDYLIGSSQIITWTDNLTGNVEIQLFKGGIFHSIITTSTASDGTYTWNIPGTTVADSDYRIRISSADDGNVFDLSDADFTLSHEIIVTVPNGGESWQAGTSHTISWTDNITGNVKIELYKGGTFDSEISPSTPSTGSYTWDIPVGTAAGLNYKVKISSIDNTSISDLSDNNFEIFEGIITVITPNGGESWVAGTTQTINWTDNITENITIDLYKGGTLHSIISTSTSSDGTRNWNIPFALESGSDYKVKITSVNDPGISDFSSSNFTIVGNQVTVTTPDGGEDWQVGSSQIINWTDNLTGNVEIQLFKSGIFHSSLTGSTPSDGAYTWNISNTLIQGSDYSIRISSVDDGNIFDFSDADFTLSNEIIVTTPNGTESWRAGTSHTINWTDNITGNVKIQLYDNGSFDSEITPSTPGNGSFSWDIPVGTSAGTNYKVKISSVDNSSIFDFSDNNFEIFEGNITVVSPNGGESWQAGTTQTITWTDNIAENITVDLYKGGTLHSIISTSTSSDGTRNWTIPFALESGSDYSVKITSVNDPGIFDFSNSNFAIVGNQVTVATPDGGEDWQVGSSQIINWTDNLTGNVEIQLFKSGIFQSSLTGSTPSDGAFTWNISNTLIQGSDYSIRISSVDDGNIFDFSDADFTLSNELIVTVPDGGESWRAGTSHTISWTDNITGNVKIQLYDNGSFDSEITPSAPSNGSFSWNIPVSASAGTKYKVKISSVDNSSIFDFSDNNFEIFEGNITVVSPNGGESWQAGTTQTITWTDNINENVTIDLYKGGSFHSVVSTSTSSDGSKTWNIPFTLESGSNYKVKITSVDDPGISDFSSSNFTIVSNQITVTTPNGGESWLDTEELIISWTDNLTGSVEIQLFKNDLFHSSITTSTPSDGAYTWNIPGTTPSASDYKIKIISVNDGNIFDLSDDNFTIINNEIIVILPNGGESWLTGSSQEITWSDNITENVKIELYKSEVFDSDITPSTPSTGSYTWDIPSGTATGSDYKIKVTSVDQPVLFDLSNSSFTIFTGQITVSSPDGGESWMAGSSQNITWTDNINGNVTIDLYKVGSFHSVISASTSSDGSKVWNIPFALESGSNYKVKITSVNDPGISDFSSSNFAIVGNQVTVTTPDGGEDWQVGSSQIINWTDNFTGNVEIQLFKSGIFQSSITGSTPSDGAYTWNISNSLIQGSDYSIRISSVNDGNIFDFSDADFTLSNELIVTVPDGGESWRAGTSHTINWTDNITGNVKIQLYDNGSFDSEITPSTPSNGSFSWDVPVSTSAGTNYKVKISSVDNSSIFDLSDSNFEIFEGSITVVSPNGGESWQAGTTQSITWTDNINENVTIDLYKGGSFHSVISTSTSSDGAKTWALPFTLESGSNYKVKITSVNDPGISDFSNSNFTIVSNQITVTTPNGSESWLDTEDQIISWADNLTGNVEIQLFKGGVFHSSITTSTPSDGAYTWNIPGTTVAGSDYTIKILSVDEGNVFDMSDGNFTIINNNITLTSPNGAESWLTGSTQEITWTDDISGDVKIELYQAEVFNSTITSSTPSDGSYSWDIPGGTATGSNYKVKITSIDQPVLSDISNNSFTIFTGNITVVSPNGGESWLAGSSQNITWTDNITENVIIELYKGGSLHSVISTSTGSDGSKVWDIPFALESGSNYKVKITSVNDPGISDFSSSNFTIVGNQVTVTTPDGGEDWQIGSSQIINWTDNFTGNVEIQLFKSGIFQSSITGSTPSDGAYTWNISNSLIQGSDYSIRISSVNDGNIFDFSDADFTLSNELIVTVPDGGESWRAGTSHTISWTDNITGNVKIELYDNGSFDSEITPSTPSNGSFSWDIPVSTSAGTNYKVKISSVDNSSIFDLSDNNFEIFEGNITIVSPNGGESWQAGTTQSITWTDNINENVTIDLYKGGSFHSVISTSTSSDGAKTWALPFTLESGSNYKVKITSVDDPGISDFSNSNFTIVSNQVTVTTPDGGENWQVGSSQIISWTDNLTGKVEIQLFKGGAFRSSITTSTSSDGAFTWNISNTLVQGSDYSIRISSVDDGNIFDFSDADFILSNVVIITIPNGTESWQTGTSHTISWTDNLTENVKIELYKNGIFESEITTSTPSNGSFSWDIPISTPASLNFTVKITSVDNTSVFDFSDANFEIFSGNVTVVSPNGGESWTAGTTQIIFWTDNINENVTIDLYKGGSLHSVISASTSSDGSKVWDLSFTLETGSDYSIKIASIDDPGITDFSDAEFTIIGNKITVTTPNGGENWLDTENHIIIWTDNLEGNVEIQLLKGGVFHSSITTSTPSDGAYTWNIPGSTPSSSDYMIKIISVDDGDIIDLSDGNFTIINNNIAVTSPDGGESWSTGNTREITWTDDILGNVRIELYKNELFDSEIIASTESDGSYNWNVPDGLASGSDYKVRISSVDQPVLMDLSDNNFTIFTGSIIVSAPNGGENWQAGTTQTITWTDNINENVTIDLYKGGSFHSVISTSTGSDGSKIWDIPFTLESGTDYKVRIGSEDNASIFDFSDADFTIFGNQVSVTSPNGGEDWQVSSSQIITWTDNLIGRVEIQLFKGGVFHSSITTSTPSDGSYTWNISSSLVQASDYNIKITSVDDNNIFDFSDGDFTLSNTIIVVVPNGSENWQQGTQHNINWTDNVSGNVKIELYKGGVYDSEITPSTTSSGSYTWNIPITTAPGSDYKVKISSVNNASVFDFSDANFEIFSGNITVVSPNGSESWQAGTTQTITWTDNINENVKIDLYKGGLFHSAISTSTSSDGSKTWNIPFTLESGSDFSVLITSVDDPAITDFSDADFTIVSNQITVISPNGGENWLDTENQIITWTDNLLGNVEIQLFKGGAFHSSITTSTPSDGAYTWNIPGTTPSGSDYSVKIISVNEGNVFDLSDGDFTIINNDITVNSPNGGESWLTGNLYEITWTDANIGNIKIELYKSEVFNSTIVSSTPSDGSYFWDIPVSTTTGSDYKVKITNLDQPILFDFSNSAFTIFTGNITLTLPNGGENLQAGTSQNITWTDNISENVTIDLYKSGLFHSVISTSTSSDGSKNWDIPFALESGSDYTVKITSVTNLNLFDFSDADFSIIGNQITVTSPDGGEDYQVGTSQIIAWTDNLTGNVEIQLHKGGVFHSSIVTSTASDGAYTWNISTSLVQGSDYRIRISSIADGNIFDFSDADFTLSNEIIVTIPNGGESWQAGTLHNIIWTDNITGNVKIELYKDGVFDSEITSSTPSTSNYNWNIPPGTAAGSDYKVKILNVDNNSVLDFSDANFTIFTGNITVVTPNGGENWQAGITQTITWNDNITENVTIDLYKGGTFHSSISTTTGSDGSKTWAIPFSQEAGNNYTVKITSVNDPGITDFSDADFTIVGNQVTVISPKGGENWLDSDDQIISWSDNLTGNVEIQLLKSGLFHSSITTSTPSDGSFTWNIPGATSSGSDYKIKIISVDDGNIFGISDADFTIINNNITVLSPNGGESWLIGSTHEITWNDDIDGDVLIELIKGESPTPTFIASVPSNGFFTWNIPDSTTPGSDYKIKITSVAEPAISDVSNNNFTLFTGFITVASPNGGENWQAGTTKSITWVDNITENVKIELFKGGVFHSEISNLTNSDGSKTWDIPFGIESGSDYKVKITKIDDDSTYDFSDEYFTIVGNQITVTSPNGGESWLDNEDQIISWNDNLIGNVAIQLFKGGSFHSIISTSTASSGSFPWNIPGSLESGSDYKIRISSVADGSVFDFSDENFTIINNNITVTSPNGGENWLTGSIQTITWTDDIIGDVKIELFKTGVFHSTIISSTTSNGSFVWNLPGSTPFGLDYKIKITSVVDTILFDESNNDFIIFTGAITVVSPNGGEIWQAGTTQTIIWTDNISENVKIELFKSGVFHSSIINTTSSDGSKTWDIPFGIESGLNYKIKIIKIDDNSTFDFSDANFEITGFTVTVNTPNGGEIWLDTEDHIIEWTSNLTGNVEIQLFKSGVFRSTIVSSTSNDGSFSWNIPGSIESGSDYKVQIASVNDGNINDQSDSNFTIISDNITLVAPNGGENWLTGTSQNITWIDDIVEDVRIDLYKGGAFSSTIAESTPSTGSYNWTIPGTIEFGLDYMVKISSVVNPILFDMSNNNFTIFTGDITITSPNGGENWQANSAQVITWTDNITENVRIELLKNDTLHSTISPATTSDGSKVWNIPFDLESGSDYKIKIISVDNENTIDLSDSEFTITGFEVTVTSPNGGEDLLIGSEQIITWTDNLVGNVEIQLFKGGVFHSQLENSTASDGSFIWNISPALLQGSDYSIMILSVNDGNIFDLSDDAFTLLSEIIVTAPNGGEIWQAGTQHNITWTDNIVGDVKIELYKNGVFSLNIVVSTPGNQDFIWDIPSSLQPDSDFKIKIISVNNNNIADFSDSNFTIESGSITLSSPNSGEIWQAGTSHPITWLDNINENVKIELYKGGFFHSEINPSTSSDGTSNWQIPFDLESGTNYKVKLTSVNNPDIYDFSDNNFTIVGVQITVISPNGGEHWVIGSAYEITWNDNLSGNVQILLYKGGTLFIIISTSTASDGSRPWTVPSVLEGSDYKIRISSVDDGNIFDESDADFTIDNITGIENLASEIPDLYELYQNYPNPFNPSTKIEFGLPEESNVSLRIYDITGQEVEVVLNNESFYPGTFRYDFNASNLPSGVYFYILIAESIVSDLSIKQTKKMILLK